MYQLVQEPVLANSPAWQGIALIVLYKRSLHQLMILFCRIGLLAYGSEEQSPASADGPRDRILHQLTQNSTFY